MPAGDIFRLQQFFRVGSELTENVIHFRMVESEAVDELPAFSLISLWHDRIIDLYGTPLFSQDSRCEVMRAIRIDPTSGIPATVVFGGAGPAVIVGGDEAERVPSQAAALISLYSAQPTRSGRGRNYWPGVSVDAQNDGQLTSDAFGNLSDLADAYIDEFGPNAPGTATFSATIWSKADDTHYNIINAQPHSNLATIRNRRAFPGLGT